MSAVLKKQRLGDLLLEKGILTPDQLRIALKEQRKRGQKLGQVVVALGFTTEAIMRDVLSENLGQQAVDLSKVVIDSELLQLIPKDYARRHRLLPLSLDRERKRLTVAMADTLNVVAIDQLSAQLGGVEVVPVLAGEADIDNAIEQFYGFELSIDGILHEIETGQQDPAALQAGSDEYSQPLVRLVDALLADAVKRGASDIHFEPEAGFLRVRYRIDGVLRQVRSLHLDYWSGIAVRLKVMSGMNIAESRAPQDGRISLTLFGRPVDFRVSAQPTTHGENIVLRVLDRSKGIVSVDQLGLDEESVTTLKMMLARPEGIFLVTGPTGSGKTTTLYAILNHINTEAVNIMTLEDPVEYPMAMIRQTSVNEVARMDFASGIRSLLRQDPDVILIGEIRDEATADMALRAAMTGHQVFSTVHTNSAIGAIPRMFNLGIVPEILAGNVIGIMGQRLVRKLCPRCRERIPEGEVGALERRLLGVSRHEPLALYRARGCEACDYVGYKGRMALTEFLWLDEELDELVARRASPRELYHAALARGFRPLAEDGIRRILAGATTLDEVSRVVDLTARLR